MKVAILSGHGGYTVTQGLYSFFGKENVTSLFCDDLLAKLQSQKDLPDLIVLPGGSSQKMGEDFGPKGKEIVKDYVYRGGRLMGICAGAALAASTTVFFPIGYEKITSLGAERIGLLPVSAVGPLPPPEGYEGPYSQGIEELAGCELSQHTVNAYYGGGCAFRVDKDADVEVIAHFSRLVGRRTLAEVKERASAAIVCGKFGKGKVLLSGVHPDVKLIHIDYLKKDLQTKKGRNPLRSAGQQTIAKNFMDASMLSVINPANERFLYSPSEWFHDVLLTHFMGCDPVHRYDSDEPTLTT